MSAVSGGGNYISDSQVMEWLAVQQDRIYGELGENMTDADDRKDFVAELGKIKADLHGAKSNDAIKELDQELQAFMSKYGSDPRFAEEMEGLDGIASRVNADAKAVTVPEPEPLPDAHGSVNAADGTPVTAAADAKGGHGAGPPNLTAPPGTHWEENAGPHGEGRFVRDEGPAPFAGYSKDDLDTWDGLISTKTDHASKNDQLTMIHIQELRSTLDQGSQLASSFISSGDKTSSAIIGNIA